MAIKITQFTHFDTGLVSAEMETPIGKIQFSGCWDSRTDKWHKNSQPVWTVYSYNSNGSTNVEEIDGLPPQPKRPSKASFLAATRTWFKARYPNG